MYVTDAIALIIKQGAYVQDREKAFHEIHNNDVGYCRKDAESLAIFCPQKKRNETCGDWRPR